MSQEDFFASDTQAELFGAEPVPAYKPDPDKVRKRLHAILGEARAAHVMPWKPVKLTLYRTIFPRMASFLPEDEGAQFCFEFETELKRLEAA